MSESSAATSAEKRRARFRVIGLLGGYKVTQAIYCAVALGLPEALEKGPQRIDVLAEACGVEANRLEQLLRALCALGIVSQVDGCYASTPLSGCLCAGAPGSIAPTVLFQGNEMYRAFGHLLDTLRTGVPGWEAEFGGTLWDYLERHPERSALFDRSMADDQAGDFDAIANVLNGTEAGHVADIGGGNGWLLKGVLQHQPAWTGTLFDRSEVILRAQRDPAMQALGERCRFVAGDFFREVPAGADVYLLRHVLHDWNDDECIRILSRCRHAMGPGAKLLVIEALMGMEPSKGMAEWSNLSMLLIGGVERPLDRYESLLSASGFAAAGAKPVGPGLFAIEANPAG